MQRRAFAEERAQALGTSLQELTGAAGSSGSEGFFETGEEARRRWREQRDAQDQQENKEEPISIAKGANLPFSTMHLSTIQNSKYCCAFWSHIQAKQ